MLVQLLKHTYQRERPSIIEVIDAVGYSFPSGHAMVSLIFYGFLTYIMARKTSSKALKWSITSLASILVLSIGLSRVYLEAHYPSEIVVGYLAGSVWLILNLITFEWVKWQSERKKSARM
ncbi:phosphatase PAP2 family protein [Metabacillus litoralis]|uniref:phosphatase PAP2 family protein n=1 Tax=Metabacillus litoralis TaxID=152268 RepID=UPI0039B03682